MKANNFIFRGNCSDRTSKSVSAFKGAAVIYCVIFLDINWAEWCHPHILSTVWQLLTCGLWGRSNGRYKTSDLVSSTVLLKEQSQLGPHTCLPQNRKNPSVMPTPLASLWVDIPRGKRVRRNIVLYQRTSASDKDCNKGWKSRKWKKAGFITWVIAPVKTQVMKNRIPG